jgi:hypothetical protein
MEIVAGLAGLLTGAAAAWHLARRRAAAETSRLQARISYWRDEADRAKASAARAEEQAVAWAAGYQQGREDVLSLARAFSETNVGNSFDIGLEPFLIQGHGEH